MLEDIASLAVPPSNFEQGYRRFQILIERDSGHPFRSFDEGRIAVWENYKPYLRDYALSRLRAGEWSESQIGTGEILRRTIEAIEIQDNRPGGHVNNLLSWQNRWGHAHREHRAFLEAEVTTSQRAPLERLLFGLYRGGADEGHTFDRLSELTGRKYPLMAYLYFLKDIDRFMPINPTGFDRAFRALGIELTTLRQIGWENYTAYNATLDGLRPLIAKAANLKSVHLVDAHSFCWVFSTLIDLETKGAIGQSAGDNTVGRVLGGREKAAAAMRWSVENTVMNSNGQFVERTVKNKDLTMTGEALEQLLIAMLELQGDRCALTGIPFHYDGPDVDKALKPSLDRIDSNGHYAVGNLQVVCQFVNFWKSDRDNEEFKRLLMLVRGEPGIAADTA